MALDNTTPAGSSAMDTSLMAKKPTKSDVIKQKRSITRRLTTNLIKKIEENLKGVLIDEDELQDNLSELESKEIKLNKIDDELSMELNDLKLIEDELMTSDSYSNNIRKIKNRIKKSLSTINASQIAIQNVGQLTSQNLNQASSLNATPTPSQGSSSTTIIPPLSSASTSLGGFISPPTQTGATGPQIFGTIPPATAPRTNGNFPSFNSPLPQFLGNVASTSTVGANGNFPRFNSPLSQWTNPNQASTNGPPAFGNTPNGSLSGSASGNISSASASASCSSPGGIFGQQPQFATPAIGAQNYGMNQAHWQRMKLPEIKVYTFGGEVSKWTEFWGRFDVAIHQNCTIPNVQKFIYLRSYLEGTALSAISGLELSEVNYTAAVKILKTRFGRTDVQIHSHINRLFALSPVRKESDLTALRKLYDSCESEIAALELLGSNFKEYGPVLCPFILKLIPMEITLQYSRKRNNDSVWDIKELLSVLRMELETRERANVYMTNATGGYTATKSDEAKPIHRKTIDNYYKQKPVQSSILTSSATQSRCLFCRHSNHTFETCKINSAKKKEFLKKNGRCYICATGKHLARHCAVKVECKNCSGRHHTTLCEDNESRKTEQGPEEVEDKKPTRETTVTTAVQSDTVAESILLQTANVKAIGRSSSKTVRCLFDSGSQRTYIRKDLSEKLGLRTDGEEILDVHGFGEGPSKLLTSKRVKVTLKSLFDDQTLEIMALEVPEISMAKLQIPGKKLRETIKVMGLILGDQPRSDLQEGQRLDVLIGTEYYWEALTGRHKRIDKKLMALESKFGWLLHGPETSSCLEQGSRQTSVSVNLVTTQEIEVIGRELRAFWELENIGIKEIENENLASQELVRKFENQRVMKDGRYEVNFPWKEVEQNLPNNYEMAQKRLRGLLKRLKSDRSLLEEYNRVFMEYAREGIIEEVKESEDTRKREGVFYLPHHPVIKSDRTTSKVRIVFDGSAHERDRSSLNDCLESGPNLNPELYDILIKFRTHQVAITADVKQAFLQISIAKEERDFVRFLWINGMDQISNQEKVKVWRFTRVLFGLTCSPFLLNATIRSHAKNLEGTYPETSRKIQEDMYVDDLTSGDVDDEAGKKLITESIQIFEKAGMSLRKFQTNSPTIRAYLNQSMETRVTEEKTIFQGPENNKVLGLSWSPKSDYFTFEITGLLEFLKNFDNTKRSVLSAAARIFDPIGFLTPFTIIVKTIFQSLWREGVGWDDDLPENISTQWKGWSSQLKDLPSIEVARCYFELRENQKVQETQLHVFCDSSETAYGSVAYVRFQTEDGKIGTSFVSSKARVTPIKRITLPRLELLGALTGARLSERLRTLLGIEKAKVYLWTDSTVTYYWIKGHPRNWKPFVANRVGEIQRLSESQSWRHCRGVENPADFLTRGLTISELKSTKAWWKGPLWLEFPETEWPRSHPKTTEASEGIEAETRAKAKETATNTCTNQVSRKPFLTLENHSDLRAVLKITAWSQRYLYNLRNKDAKRQGPLSAEDLEKAETYWNKVTQEESFKEELIHLKIKKPIKNPSIAELDPFLDETGVMRVGGRLQKSPFSFSEKHPVILPYQHKYSELQMKLAHQTVCHCGIPDTLVQVREKYWILKGRQLAKNCVNRCWICRRWKVKHCIPKTAPLPRDRITESKPFEIIGLDYAGPIYIKDWKETRKCYILLLTCANTRAVHLELVSDQSTEYFLLAFKRFISRRGVPSIIYSDNAKTFKRAEKELASMWKNMNTEKVRNFFANFRITWKYIVERGPWWGGFYERLVQSVKIPMKKIVGRAFLNFEEMTTVLTEIEAVLNSRPLTYTYSEPEEPSPLTPGHFLIGSRLTSIPPFRTSYTNTVPKPEELKRRLAYQQRLSDRFWNRWKTEYILQLQSAHKLNSRESTHAIKKGDVVLLDDENAPRTKWKLARVEAVHVGRDGEVRSCELKLGKGGIVRRPINHMCLLEHEM